MPWQTESRADGNAGRGAMATDSRQAGGAPLEPGMRVRHPGRPDWGIGQIQSVVGHRVTVNFAEAGKVLINAQVVTLVPVED